MTVLKFDNVTMRATTGIVEILKNLSFAVEAGDFIALTGPSGAGKTSLLRLMNRLSEASSGTIEFEDQDIRQWPVVSLRRQVALVHQESRLLGMSVREALAYPLRLQKLAPTAITAAVAAGIEQLNIPLDWLDCTSANLSLAQRQRVAIARTLITQPKVLLLDEPTSAQAVGDSEFLLAHLANLAKQGQITIIMTNRQLELAARYTNRLLYLSAGNLIADVPASKANWAQIHQDLVTAEQQAEAEWS